MSEIEHLSPWWRRAVAFTFVFGFTVLILLTVRAYQNAPPVPGRVIDAVGMIVFTGDDVRRGQDVFLKHGLMDNGTIWGHGGYLGPDFGAAVLHDWAEDLARRTAQTRFSKNYADLDTGEHAAVDGEVGALLKINRYDAATDTLTLLPAGTETFRDEIGVWQRYFEIPAADGGLPVRAVSDPQELHDLTAFFTWAA
jgi:nitric oxide reductase subunit B